ncbi:hypothetical protein LXL04_000105 [Taraxacum kok-saghyz]
MLSISLNFSILQFYLTIHRFLRATRGHSPGGIQRDIKKKESKQIRGNFSWIRTQESSQSWKLFSLSLSRLSSCPQSPFFGFARRKSLINSRKRKLTISDTESIFTCKQSVVNGALEAMSICGDCNFLFLEDTHTQQHTTPTTTYNMHDDDDENIHGNVVSGPRLQRSLGTNGRNLPVDWVTGIDGGYIEYVDGEIDGWGPPPTSASFVKNLERLVVGDDVEGLVCVICKDSVCVGSVVNRLPCLHVYHGSCIRPWLNTHNTCPLCRYMLPTDGGDRRHVLVSGGGWWWFVVAPLATVVGVGLMLWLRRGFKFCLLI